MSDKTFHIELEFKGIPRRDAASVLFRDFHGRMLCPLLGSNEEYMVADHFYRDWFLMQGEVYDRLFSPCLEYPGDRLFTLKLMEVLKRKGAFMDKYCQVRVRAQGLSQAEADGIVSGICERLERND